MQFKKTHGFGIRSIVTRCGQYDAFYKFRTPGHIPSAPCVQLMQTFLIWLGGSNRWNATELFIVYSGAKYDHLEGIRSMNLYARKIR